MDVPYTRIEIRPMSIPEKGTFSFEPSDPAGWRRIPCEIPILIGNFLPFVRDYDVSIEPPEPDAKRYRSSIWRWLRTIEKTETAPYSAAFFSIASLPR